MYNAQKRTKLDPKLIKCIILDHTDRMKGYHLWDPTSYEVMIDRDVIVAKDL